MSDSPSFEPISEELRRRVDGSRRGLLRVHKALLDWERAAYERVRGPVRGSGELLQLVIHDPWFAWLGPLSQLIVRMDELTESEQPPSAGEARALLAEAAEMLRGDPNGSDFQRHYYQAIQESPEVVGAHAQWKRLAE